MKIGVIGAPSTGKSVFAKSIAAELTRRGHSCELVQEYASTYIQQAGAPLEAWEQLVISVGQYLAEQESGREHMVTDATAFATYIYAQRFVPKSAEADDWPKYRALLDVLRAMARRSVESYDLLFLLTHVFPPRDDGVRMKEHLAVDECRAINRDFETYLIAERAPYLVVKANRESAVADAVQRVEQELLVVSRAG